MHVLTLDLVDYPGGWLLEFPLLGKSYVSGQPKASLLARGRGSNSRRLGIPISRP